MTWLLALAVVLVVIGNILNLLETNRLCKILSIRTSILEDKVGTLRKETDILQKRVLYLESNNLKERK